jgi:membrane protease YdiL (CAAX protease family)
MANQPMPITRRTVFYLSLLTLLGFSAVGAIIIQFFYQEPLYSVLQHGIAWQHQIFVGLSYGVIAAFAAYILLQHQFLKPVKDFFLDFTNQLNLSKRDMVWFSICAGIGEEILFRAAIQQTLGIWPTAVLFIVLHGYLNPFRFKLTLYGVIMVIVSAGLGYLYEFAGLFSAIVAHMIFDILLFLNVK